MWGIWHKETAFITLFHAVNNIVAIMCLCPQLFNLLADTRPEKLSMLNLCRKYSHSIKIPFTNILVCQVPIVEGMEKQLQWLDFANGNSHVFSRVLNTLL